MKSNATTTTTKDHDDHRDRRRWSLPNELELGRQGIEAERPAACAEQADPARDHHHRQRNDEMVQAHPGDEEAHSAPMAAQTTMR